MLLVRYHAPGLSIREGRPLSFVEAEALRFALR